MKKEIVLALAALISFSVMADELVENQSPQKAMRELTSATENTEQTLSEETSGDPSAVSVQEARSGTMKSRPKTVRGQLPAGVSLHPRLDPFEDYKKDKPQYQFITVLKSTIPEVQEGSVFKSNTHGVKFYFNGYWLFLNKNIAYFPSEFGETLEKYLYQWEFSNYLEGSTRCSNRVHLRGVRMIGFYTPEGIEIPVVSCLCDPIPVNEPMSYPLRLTNDLYFIEFSAPEPLDYPQK